MELLPYYMVSMPTSHPFPWWSRRLAEVMTTCEHLAFGPFTMMDFDLHSFIKMAHLVSHDELYEAAFKGLLLPMETEYLC